MTVRNAVIILALTASPVAAQIQVRPTDPPPVTAANESWYQLREPIMFAGNLYYRAGAAVFFDGKTMVRSGYYNGVPLYMDTTIEPYSVVLVPVRTGVMQPYERLRRGDLASTTGSRAPSFPVGVTADRLSFPGATALSPTELPRPLGAIPASEATVPARPAPILEITSTQSAAPARSPEAPMVSIVRPDGNDGVWIHYQGTRWISAGPAVPLRSTEFRAVGQYEGFPVFVRLNEVRLNDEKTIYLPTRAGLVAPYKAR